MKRKNDGEQDDSLKFRKGMQRDREQRGKIDRRIT